MRPSPRRRPVGEVHERVRGPDVVGVARGHRRVTDAQHDATLVVRDQRPVVETARADVQQREPARRPVAPAAEVAEAADADRAVEGLAVANGPVQDLHGVRSQ
jgi:hypothetical protein